VPGEGEKRGLEQLARSRDPLCSLLPPAPLALASTTPLHHKARWGVIPLACSPSHLQRDEPASLFVLSCLLLSRNADARTKAENLYGPRRNHIYGFELWQGNRLVHRCAAGNGAVRFALWSNTTDQALESWMPFNFKMDHSFSALIGKWICKLLAYCVALVGPRRPLKTGIRDGPFNHDAGRLPAVSSRL
jgi:hypothetical protein